MKSHISNSACGHPRRLPAPSTRTGGAVIIVVISLLMTLTFLGLFFYNWTSQEVANAENFASTSTAANYSLDPDPILDAALEQVLVGTRSQYNQSVLAGSDFSMLAGILGRPVETGNGLEFDAFPRNGRGISILPSLNTDPSSLKTHPGGEVNDYGFGVDYNGDGLADANQTNFVLNMSPAANGGTASGYRTQFAPDAGYTYPDQNSMFLGFDGYVTGSDAKEYRVIIPSFFRPQLLTAQRSPAGNLFNTIYTDNSTAAQVFRPHQNHVDVYGTGHPPRFVTPADYPNGREAQSGDTSRIIPPMAFTTNLNSDANSNDAGIFTSTSTSTPFAYEYDGDVDRDGVRDSILMDLGYPLIDLPGGRQVVPLFMMKWIDADGLLNVNVHGNIANFELLQQKMVDDTTVMNPPTWKPTVMAGKSNLGISASEVNLARALFADPSDGNYITQSVDMLNWALTQHRGMFLNAPNNIFPNINNIPRTVMANMETIMLLCGRRQFAYDGSSIANSSDLPGRRGLDANMSITDMVSYGTRNLTNSNSSYTPNFSPNATSVGAPKPGLQDLAATPTYDEGNDDANDANSETLNANFGMPIDYLGIGTSTQTKAGVQGKVQALSDGSLAFATTGSAGPGIVKYPQYSQFWGASRYSSNNAYAGNLQQSPISSISNEEDEMFVEPGLRMTSRDRVFETAEMFALLASDGDRASAGTSSRLLDLASFNFRDNRYAYRIRPQFTTDSWDRLEFSYTPFAARAWEFNNWGKNTTAFGLSTPFAITSAFPPKFAGADVNSTTDPFRPEVRRALASIARATGTVGRWDWHSQGFRSLRLNLNRLLSAYNVDGTPKYTELTKHQTAAVNGGDDGTPLLLRSVVTYDDNPKEWNARHERQKMARDIYVLLYTLGGGNDTVDYSQTSNADRSLYSDDQLKEMAQFAVNVVDELDQDNVITVFEYDRDLSDGWNLDDNAFDDVADSTAPYNIPTADRGVVYGVEAQTLSLSEVLLISAGGGSDTSATPWDDSAQAAFGYIELQSVLPRSVDFSKEQWRVQIKIEGVATQPSLILKQGEVPAGGQFSIGTASSGQNNSQFQVDPTGGASPVVIIPAKVDPMGEAFDLDLVGSAPMGMINSSVYEIIDENGLVKQTTSGGFFTAASAATALNAPKTTISLWRKVTLDRPINTDPEGGPTLYQDEERDNPWVCVDRMEITGQGDSKGGIQKFDSSATPLSDELKKLQSRERPQPFDRLGESRHTSTNPNSDNANAYHTSNAYHTFGDLNEASQPDRADIVLLPDGFNLWQPHFDRDFTSKYALLSVPLYGPDQTTSQLAYVVREGDSTYPRDVQMHWTRDKDPDADNSTWGNVAARKFCVPQDPSNNVSLNNRWYRILEFFEVDNRELQRLQNLVTSFRRTPGQINLNTLRHEPVLAALIDDDQINNITSGSPPQWANAMEGAETYDIYNNDSPRYDSSLPTYLDIVPDTDPEHLTKLVPLFRNWFRALQQARDGYDYLVKLRTGVSVPIPGNPGSHPYRSGTFVGGEGLTVDWNLQNQMLRNDVALFPKAAWPNKEDPDAAAAPYFGLFEARVNCNDYMVEPYKTNYPGMTGVVDYHTRNRLLQKIANHATNRSHVFAGWIEIELHEAHYPDQANSPNTVQIGGKADDLPTYRMFCVVDMSRLEEAYDSRTNTYDFRKFIIHRQLLP